MYLSTLDITLNRIARTILMNMEKFRKVQEGMLE